MYGLRQTVPPTGEPVTLAEAMEWLRVPDDTPDGGLITGMLKAARGYVEKTIGRQLMPATWELTLDSFPYPGGWQFLEAFQVCPDPHQIRIPKAPLRSVSGITYYDMSYTLRTCDPSIYVVDTATDPGRIVLAQAKVWPVTGLRPAAVKVTFTAGYDEVPEEAKVAIKFLVGHWYENRESIVIGATPAEVQMTTNALLGALWNGELEYGI